MKEPIADEIASLSRCCARQACTVAVAIATASSCTQTQSRDIAELRPGRARGRKKQEPKEKEKKDEPQEEGAGASARSRTGRSSSRPTRGRGSRSTSRPTARRSSSSCWATSTPCRSTGGEAKAITTGLAFDSQPSYSPDGKMIAFVSDRDGAENLWVAGADGSDAQAADQGQAEPVRLAVVDARRRLRARLAAAAAPVGCLRALDVPRPRRLRACRSPRASPSPTPSRTITSHAIGAVASRDGKYLYYTKRNKLFNAYNNLNFPLSQVVAARSGDRRRRHDHRGPRQRLPAGALARRDQARLRDARRQRDRAADPRPGERRGALAEAARPARRARVAVHPRPDPGLRLHARRQVGAGGLRRQDPPARRPDRRRTR